MGSGTPGARAVYLDRERDLALLRAARLGFPSAERRASVTLEIGEHVFAVGAPQGLELDSHAKCESLARYTSPG